MGASSVRNVGVLFHRFCHWNLYAARASMVIQIIGASVNMVLDPIFIFGLNMGVSGAAWATVLAFVVPSVLAMCKYVTGWKMFVRFDKSYLAYDRAAQRDILSVGLPEAIELSLMNFFSVFLNYCVIYVGGTDMLVYSYS